MGRCTWCLNWEELESLKISVRFVKCYDDLRMILSGLFEKELSS